MVFYVNTFTLFLFLILGIPRLCEKVDFSKSGDRTEKSLAGGLVAILAGIVMVTTVIWAGPMHTYQGDKRVQLLIAPLIVVGTLLNLVSNVLFFRAVNDLIQNSD